jgi:predicted RNase H-like HicB family nuclease
MKKEFTVVVEQDEEGYFVAEVPGLPGCHTQTRSLDVLMKRVREAIALCVEVQKKQLPKTHLVGVQRIEVTV